MKEKKPTTHHDLTNVSGNVIGIKTSSCSGYPHSPHANKRSKNPEGFIQSLGTCFSNS